MPCPFFLHRYVDHIEKKPSCSSLRHNLNLYIYIYIYLHIDVHK